MRSPTAFITVSCDSCRLEENIELTSTARGYDERDVDTQLEQMGWRIGDGDLCPDCVELIQMQVRNVR